LIIIQRKNAMPDRYEAKRDLWKREALAEHDRLSRLYVENRFAFELERKQLIADCINNYSNRQNDSLQDIQHKLDHTLKNSGSIHNRLVLMQMFFWDQVKERFNPALKDFKDKLKVF